MMQIPSVRKVLGFGCAMMACSTLMLHAQPLHPDIPPLPHTIYSGPQGDNHVQGIAYDRERNCVYMSFTTSFIKLDMQGRLVGSVVGLTGHLGCMALNPDDGCVYASLEYKHDVIGKGLQKGIDPDMIDQTNGFYVAIFDPDRITRPLMPASEVMKTVFLEEPTRDFEDSVCINGTMVPHRFGCSGIDGLALAPAWGKRKGRNRVYVAYGIYGDLTRSDNDYQVILCYDIRKWKKYAQPLSQQHLHHSGPKKPDEKYFLHTGNTEWGIQNLAYDPSSGHMLAAVYPGKKKQWPGYSLFAIDGSQKPRMQRLEGLQEPTKGKVLQLLPSGLHDPSTGTWGWNLQYGSTGICALGNGYFYVSHNARDKQTGKQCATLHLYHWDGQQWHMIE